jgi:hypothetical protein
MPIMPAEEALDMLTEIIAIEAIPIVTVKI